MPGAVDTLRIYERLKDADLVESAAKEIAEVIKETTEEPTPLQTSISKFSKNISIIIFILSIVILIIGLIKVNHFLHGRNQIMGGRKVTEFFLNVWVGGEERWSCRFFSG